MACLPSCCRGSHVDFCWELWQYRKQLRIRTPTREADNCLKCHKLGKWSLIPNSNSNTKHGSRTEGQVVRQPDPVDIYTPLLLDPFPSDRFFCVVCWQGFVCAENRNLITIGYNATCGFLKHFSHEPKTTTYRFLLCRHGK